MMDEVAGIMMAVNMRKRWRRKFKGGRRKGWAKDGGPQRKGGFDKRQGQQRETIGQSLFERQVHDGDKIRNWILQPSQPNPLYLGDGRGDEAALGKPFKLLRDIGDPLQNKS